MACLLWALTSSNVRRMACEVMTSSEVARTPEVRFWYHWPAVCGVKNGILKSILKSNNAKGGKPMKWPAFFGL